MTWSPNGHKLAYVASTVMTFGLWTMNADGTHPKRLGTWGGRPTWSPDGRRIAFAANLNGRLGIWVVNADGSNLRLLKASNVPGLCKGPIGDPAWSPDGRRIAFDCVAGWGGQIYVMNTDGSKVRRLTYTSSSAPNFPYGAMVAAEQPAWSPDGQRIAFMGQTSWCKPEDQTCSIGDPNDDIYVMDANGSSRVLLTHNHVPDYDPAWSPDGHKIVFVRGNSGPGSADLYLINTDGTGLTRLTHDHISEASPTWQPATHRAGATR